jgi:hypothetical protein
MHDALYSHACAFKDLDNYYANLNPMVASMKTTVKSHNPEIKTKSRLHQIKAVFKNLNIFTAD